MGRILVVGSINQDLRARVDRRPAPGETVMGRTLEYSPGGKGANQAVAAAVAGGTVSMIGAVGDDDAGRRSLDGLTAHGVTVDGVALASDTSTGTAIIEVDETGENSIIVIPGANHSVGSDHLGPVDELGPGDVLLAQLEIPLPVVAEAVRRATAVGARAIVNLAPFAELDADTIALIDPVIVNEHEAALLAEAGLKASSILTTKGAAGSEWGEHQVAAEPVDVVDSTGAGDSYCGALAAALAAGAPPLAAMQAATAAAARTVGHLGAQPDAD